MPGPEIHNKATEMNGLTIQQLLFENCGSVPNHPWLTEHGRTNNHQILSSAACQLAKSFSLWSCCIGSGI
eukprot:1147381-Pelagomonas_calceolata.AAC.1